MPLFSHGLKRTVYTYILYIGISHFICWFSSSHSFKYIFAFFFIRFSHHAYHFDFVLFITTTTTTTSTQVCYCVWTTHTHPYPYSYVCIYVFNVTLFEKFFISIQFDLKNICTSSSRCLVIQITSMLDSKRINFFLLSSTCVTFRFVSFQFISWQNASTCK